MKVIFYGQPNMLIKERKKKYFTGEIQHKPLFRFNSNGEYETSDEGLIKKLMVRFDHKVIAETEQPKQEQKEVQPAKKILKCKKCNFETDNNGILMAHYREHKKEG
jgi:hypothetical protein